MNHAAIPRRRQGGRGRRPPQAEALGVAGRRLALRSPLLDLAVRRAPQPRFHRRLHRSRWDIGVPYPCVAVHLLVRRFQMFCSVQQGKVRFLN